MEPAFPRPPGGEGSPPLEPRGQQQPPASERLLNQWPHSCLMWAAAASAGRVRSTTARHHRGCPWRPHIHVLEAATLCVSRHAAPPPTVPLAAFSIICAQKVCVCCATRSAWAASTARPSRPYSFSPLPSAVLYMRYHSRTSLTRATGMSSTSRHAGASAASTSTTSSFQSVSPGNRTVAGSGAYGCKARGHAAAASRPGHLEGRHAVGTAASGGGSLEHPLTTRGRGWARPEQAAGAGARPQPRAGRWLTLRPRAGRLIDITVRPRRRRRAQARPARAPAARRRARSCPR